MLWVKYLKIRIFCANVHKGIVRRAPSSPIIGRMQVLNVNSTRSFGLRASQCCTTLKNSGRILHFLLRTKRIQAIVAVQAIDLGCAQPE